MRESHLDQTDKGGESIAGQNHQEQCLTTVHRRVSPSVTQSITFGCGDRRFWNEGVAISNCIKAAGASICNCVSFFFPPYKVKPLCDMLSVDPGGLPLALIQELARAEGPVAQKQGLS